MGKFVESTIRVLLIEDSESDAALIEHSLAAHGYTVVSRRVETAKELADALGGAWDIAI